MRAWSTVKLCARCGKRNRAARSRSTGLNKPEYCTRSERGSGFSFQMWTSRGASVLPIRGAMQSGAGLPRFPEALAHDVADHTEVRLDEHGFVVARSPVHIDALLRQRSPAAAGLGTRYIRRIGSANERDAAGKPLTVVGADGLERLQAHVVHERRQRKSERPKKPLRHGPVFEVESRPHREQLLLDRVPGVFHFATRRE